MILSTGAGAPLSPANFNFMVWRSSDDGDVLRFGSGCGHVLMRVGSGCGLCLGVEAWSQRELKPSSSPSVTLGDVAAVLGFCPAECCCTAAPEALLALSLRYARLASADHLEYPSFLTQNAFSKTV